MPPSPSTSSSSSSSTPETAARPRWEATVDDKSKRNNLVAVSRGRDELQLPNFAQNFEHLHPNFDPRLPNNDDRLPKAPRNDDIVLPRVPHIVDTRFPRRNDEPFQFLNFPRRRQSRFRDHHQSRFRDADAIDVALSSGQNVDIPNPLEKLVDGIFENVRNFELPTLDSIGKISENVNNRMQKGLESFQNATLLPPVPEVPSWTKDLLKSLDIFNLTTSVTNATLASPLDIFNVTRRVQQDQDNAPLFPNLDIFNVTGKVQSDLNKIQNATSTIMNPFNLFNMTHLNMTHLDIFNMTKQVRWSSFIPEGLSHLANFSTTLQI